MKIKYWTYLIIALLILSIMVLWTYTKFNFNTKLAVGQKIDSLNGVYVYYNGGVNNVISRNITSDGYNLGLKYQCVEFVKRYYYEHLKHKMPDSYGHAKHFFENTLKDGQKNSKRNLTQYSNPSNTKPKIDDLVIFEGSIFNKYGHVAIISHVTNSLVEIIQQNPGPFNTSRETFVLENKSGKWKVKSNRILGWLRKDLK